MNDKCVVLNAKKMNFYGKLDFSILYSDVTVYDDTTEQQLTERIQGADEIVKIAEKEDITVTLIGLCTDICVVSNAILIKAYLPEIPVKVIASCCAGVTPESHEAALATMRMCQVQVE